MKMLAWLLWLVLVATLSLPSILFAVAQAKLVESFGLNFMVMPSKPEHLKKIEVGAVQNEIWRFFFCFHNHGSVENGCISNMGFLSLSNFPLNHVGEWLVRGGPGPLWGPYKWP